MDDFRNVIYLMGTKITLYFKGPSAEAHVEAASEMLAHFETIFSANRPDSQLARLKAQAFNAPQAVDGDLYALIKLGKMHSGGDSFLNIAIGPLIKLWRIGFEEAGVPDPEAVQMVLDRLNPDFIILDDTHKTVSFLREGMEIDLGAIAKGFFCDKIMTFFKAQGATSAMVDIGGNVLVYGDSPSGDSAWKVGIQNPFLPRGHSVAVVSIRNQSVVTSGIYERVYKSGNQTYHHIFDYKTGYPIENAIASLTIIAERSVDCDIYTTRLFGLDVQAIIKRVNQLDGIEAIVITKAGQLAYTEHLKGRITF